MNNDPVLQAILLLCSYFGKSKKEDVKPLSPTEYSRLAAWLFQHKYTPADLLKREMSLIEQWQDPKGAKGITTERLVALLRRSASMGFAIEKWQQQNLWILSRGSQDYPKVLKAKLGEGRSPLLYCIGNKDLLAAPGIGFVGSRDTEQDDEDFTQALAQQAIEQGFVVVSGGAKGVDQTSMIAALEAGGSAIGVLADSLLRAATKPQYRKALKEGRLLLLTPFYPEAGFSPGNAMGRNKYIYALSKGVVVAKSAEKGGTWTGAIENLKKQWVPLWVRDIPQAGNQVLIKLGGQALSDTLVDYSALQSSFFFPALPANSTNKTKAPPVPQTPDLFGEAVEPREASNAGTISTNDTQTPKPSVSPSEAVTANTAALAVAAGAPELAPLKVRSLSPFLELFYQQLQKDSQTVHTPKDLLEKHPELNAAVVKQWLTTLTEQGFLKREGRKLVYTVINASA